MRWKCRAADWALHLSFVQGLAFRLGLKTFKASTQALHVLILLLLGFTINKKEQGSASGSSAQGPAIACGDDSWRVVVAAETRRGLSAHFCRTSR